MLSFFGRRARISAKVIFCGRSVIWTINLRPPHRRAVRVFDLDPVIARSATIDTVTTLIAINLSQLLGPSTPPKPVKAKRVKPRRSGGRNGRRSRRRPKIKAVDNSIRDLAVRNRMLVEKIRRREAIRVPGG